MLLDQVAGDQGAEGTGGAGDQDGRVGVEGRPAPRLSVSRRSPPLRRGTSATPSRRASWAVSPRRPQARRRAPVADASLPSLSIRTKRPGCSDWAERTRPQSGRRAGSGDSPQRWPPPRGEDRQAPARRRLRQASSGGARAGQQPCRRRPWPGSPRARRESLEASAGRPRRPAAGSRATRSPKARSPARRPPPSWPGSSAAQRQASPTVPAGLPAPSVSASEIPRLADREPHPQLAWGPAQQRDPAPGEGQPQLGLALRRRGRPRAGPRRAAPGGSRSGRPRRAAPRAATPRRRRPSPLRQAALRPWKAGP